MGRDVSVVLSHESSVKPIIRAIISSDSKIDMSAEKINFNIKVSSSKEMRLLHHCNKEMLKD